MNYIVVYKSSQTILSVITSSSAPTPDHNHSCYEASIVVLNHYYKLHKKALSKGVQVSVGELMHSCPSFHDQVSKGKQGKVQLVTSRIRKECEPTPPSPDERQSTILDWITSNPTAGVDDLSSKFLTGTLVAKAYLDKHR